MEQKIRDLGLSILEHARREESLLRKKHRWEMDLLDWCMGDEELKTRAFRFIDVYPSLHGADEIVRHLQEYFPSSEHRLPAVLRAGLALTRPRLLTQHAVALVTERLYVRIAALFIGAHNEKEARAKVLEFDREGYNLSIDLLGEKTASDAESLIYENRYAELIREIGSLQLGPSKQNISVKLSALDTSFDALDPRGSSRRVRERLMRLVKTAGENGVFLHIDMEDYEARDLTLCIIHDLLEQDGVSCGLGIVVQAYLKDAESALERTLPWLRKANVPVTIRLVRGAYWDTEIMKAQDLNWPIPVWTQKSDTDRTFEKITERLMDESPQIRLAVATHNVRSLAHALVWAREKSLSEERFEVQLLFGMGAALASALKHAAGCRPRIYMPIGEPVAGMAYLVRRLLENVSTQSFIRRGIQDPSQAGKLLDPPAMPAPAAPLKSNEHGLYTPTPLSQFHKEEVRASLTDALHNEAKGFGAYLPVVVGGKARRKGPHFDTVSPIDGETLVARVLSATPEEANQAVEEAHETFKAWNQTPSAKRAATLRKAAAWMRKRRYELAAAEIYEVGKTWREADADIVEAIDFLEFYAYHGEQLFKDRITEDLFQEKNFLRRRGRGVCVVIAPWNFPIAILTGMTAAALMGGNTVVMKPAEQSSYCGWLVYQAFCAAGVPEGVLHFLPGEGEEIGPALVSHPKTAIIAFTGSKEVGLQVLESAAKKRSDKKLLTKCLVEMGGKNAAIVDGSADLDQALSAVLHAAFSYAGQKCSALSRLILLDSIYDVFMKRLAEALPAFAAGSPLDTAFKCGPVIDAAARERILSFIETGKEEGSILSQAAEVPLKGFYVPPTIIGNLPSGSALLKEEIFGPVLCVLRAASFKEALEKANDSEFALTGAVFSRTPSHIEMAQERFDAGNLYINRAQTGAIVGRQPFGGYKLSGGGTKAGGIDYLREFTLERTITENVSRHGFAPLKGKSLNKGKAAVGDDGLSDNPA